VRRARYLEAGADIIATSTLTAASISMADHGMQTQVCATNRTPAEAVAAAEREMTRCALPRGRAGAPAVRSYRSSLLVMTPTGA
jgi:methionine synthase I (cobalamin-dependent)